MHTPTRRVFLALVLGLAGGLLVARSGSPAWIRVVNGVEVIGTLWVNAIRMTVVPLVVSLLITGVATTANLAALRRIGLRSLGAFLGLLALTATVALLLVPLLFSRLQPATNASVAATAPSTTIPTFTEWLVTIVPVNPVKAAADGTMLPLVIFSILFALALLRASGDGRDAVLGFFRGVGDAMQTLVRGIIALAPIGVFALLLPVAARAGTAAAGSLVYYVVAMAIACTVMLALLYPVAILVGRVSPARFARAVLPAQAVAISSSSSLASLPALIDGATRSLKLPAATANVVLPLAVSTFKIGSPLVWSVAAVFLARFYGVPLTSLQLVVIAFTALATSFSVPGVPHGWLLVISPLLAGIGIPAEGVGLLIAVDAIPDMFATTLNVTADLVAATIVSRGEIVPAVAEA